MAIDTRSMDALISELKSSRVAASGVAAKPASETSGTGSFADALKQAIDEVSKVQEEAHEMGDAFISGDKNVSLQEVMINGQKADIAFLQLVKSKEQLVSAYKDIMNMSV
jgi:flagellar hook-basal body complex protein FliE